MSDLTSQFLDAEDYSKGGCYALALAVHDRTGWPLIGECSGGPPACEKSPGACLNGEPCHVYVVAPDGARIDLGLGMNPGLVSAPVTRELVATAAEKQASLGRPPNPERTEPLAERLVTQWFSETR